MEHLFNKTIDFVGTSERSVDDAVRTAVKRASATIRDLKWFELVEVRGQITSGEVSQIQVSLKVGFALEGDATN
jgi:flavin-binding protein dodecin